MVFALLLVCVFVAIQINDTCFPAVPIYPVAEKSCDLRVSFVNEACTNKQFFSSEEEESKREQKYLQA